MVGIFTSIDFEDTVFTYSLVEGDGLNDADNDRFIITGDTLKTNDVFNIETLSYSRIYVQTDDGHGGTYGRGFYIVIQPVGVEDLYQKSVNVYPSIYSIATKVDCSSTPTS